MGHSRNHHLQMMLDLRPPKELECRPVSLKGHIINEPPVLLAVGLAL